MGFCYLIYEHRANRCWDRNEWLHDRKLKRVRKSLLVSPMGEITATAALLFFGEQILLAFCSVTVREETSETGHILHNRPLRDIQMRRIGTHKFRVTAKDERGQKRRATAPPPSPPARTLRSGRTAMGPIAPRGDNGSAAP